MVVSPGIMFRLVMLYSGSLSLYMLGSVVLYVPGPGVYILVENGKPFVTPDHIFIPAVTINMIYA